MGLEEYLSRFKITGRHPTHTRFGDGFGSYYIPAAENETFFGVYSQHVAQALTQGACGRLPGLVERHREHGPVVIDLDFRHSLPLTGSPERTVGSDAIERFLVKYLYVAKKWIPLPESFRVYVLKKPHPRVENGVVKDGAHIVIPAIVTHARVQMEIRRECVAAGEKVKLFEECRTVNPLADIFDESVIRRNGWMMYGSAKAGEPPYEITDVYESCESFGDVVLERVDGFRAPRTEAEIAEYVRLLSIRNKDACIGVRPHLVHAFEQMLRVEEVARQHILTSPMLQELEGPKVYASSDEYSLARKLCRLLDPNRSDAYASWMRVGWCLHNIDDRLLHEWVEFSQQSAKFEPGHCEYVWNHMRRQSGGLGMGSLKLWAKTDSPAGFDRIIKEGMASRVHAAISGLHHDVAMVVKAMYGSKFVCSSIRNNTWFQFKDHRWQLCDNGFFLRRLLSTEIFGRFTDEAMQCNQKAQAAGEANGDACARNSVLTDMYKKLNDVAMRLKTSNYKDAVMRECKELFYKDGFENDLDSAPHLIGFHNGVYDLSTHEFRDGTPDDNISYSTGYNYVPYDASNEHIADILEFFSKIHVNERVREYLLRLLGSYLNGHIREERFHVWTGSGANGKSLTVDLVERTFGNYACKLPVALLTQKRAASNAATSEVARLKGRRFAVLQEPSHDETLNVGLMKELTGGDTIMARQLYREPVEFKSYARLSLICNNLPNVPSTDAGSWRRIRVIDFRSKFKDDPDPANPLEFKVNLDQKESMDTWAPHMMALLIEYYKRYISHGNREPRDVMVATKSYQESQDVVQLFINAKLIVDPESTLLVSDIHQDFRDFLREMSIKERDVNTRRMEFVKELERHATVRVTGHGANQKLQGFAMQPQDKRDEEDE